MVPSRTGGVLGALGVIGACIVIFNPELQPLHKIWLLAPLYLWIAAVSGIVDKVIRDGH